MGLIVLSAGNNKGGVGKTKTIELFAEYCSKVKHMRVLAIDLDPQANFSFKYIDMEIDPSAPEGKIPPIHPDFDPTNPDDEHWDGRSSIADIFFGKPVIPYPTAIESFDICPSHSDHLLAAEQVRRSEVADKVHKQLKMLLDDPGFQQEYDLVLIDTPPSKGPLTISAMKASTHLIIPSQMEDKSIQGIYGMLQLWAQENYTREDNKLNLIGILPNRVKENASLHRDLLNYIRDNSATAKYVMPCKLNDRVAFAEVDSSGANPKSVFDLPPSNKARQEALGVCEYMFRAIQETMPNPQKVTSPLLEV